MERAVEIVRQSEQVKADGLKPVAFCSRTLTEAPCTVTERLPRSS